jgi:tetratricopeptide (TPR) repeat protein
MMKTSLASIRQFGGKYFGLDGKGYSQSLPLNGSRLTASGFVMNIDDGNEVSIDYLRIRHFESMAVDLPLKGEALLVNPDPKLKGKLIYWWLWFPDESTRVRFESGIVYFRKARPDGKFPNCSDFLFTDSKARLDAFAQTTAAWRALNPKPPLSDEVEKKRLLAEDDVSNKDLAAAVEDYEAGIKLDPTWAQGWFNSALLYAEQQDYEHAAFNMKHYLILLPDAPDAAVAKDKVLLWEARAEKAAGK